MHRRYRAVLERVFHRCRFHTVDFTDGIGENTGFGREEVGIGLGALGIPFDAQSNMQAAGIEGEVSSPTSRVKMLDILAAGERAIRMCLLHGLLPTRRVGQ